jgi:arylsulfatase A-like enzyme
MARPPNILWIVTTQWRAQACGYAGDPNARTPRLDGFAAGAANFTQAVTPHPFGPFARAALLTGVPSPGNGVRDYYDPLPAGTRTIAHALEERGYLTAFFGKWHLAPRDPNAPLVGEPHARAIVRPEYRGGFTLWEGFESGFQLNDPWLHGTRLPRPTRFAGYQADVLCQRAAEWMRSDGAMAARPWFCVVSLEPPHPPYGAAAAAATVRDPAAIVLPANVPPAADTGEKARVELAGYYAHVEATDAAIGGLLDRLDPNDTITVVTSVHGDMHGAHGLFRKGWPHEESVRVPLLVSVPPALGDQPWAGERDELVSLIDLPAWTKAWAGGDDVVVAPTAAQQISMPSVVALPHQCDRVWRGVRTHTRKLILADVPGADARAATAPWLFFDLEHDPLEQVNLIGDPARKAEIAALEAQIATPAPGRPL